MELQTIPFSKERAREMVNITFGIRKIIKNKNAPLQDHFKITTIFLVVLCILLPVILVVGIKFNSIFFLCFAGFYAAIILIYILREVALHRSAKRYLELTANTERKNILTKESITIEVTGSGSSTFLWESFKWARVFEHNIFFVAKNEELRDCLSVASEHIDEIKTFLAENGIELEFVDGDAYAK